MENWIHDIGDWPELGIKYSSRKTGDCNGRDNWSIVLGWHVTMWCTVILLHHISNPFVIFFFANSIKPVSVTAFYSAHE